MELNRGSPSLTFGYLLQHTYKHIAKKTFNSNAQFSLTLSLSVDFHIFLLVFAELIQIASTI